MLDCGSGSSFVLVPLDRLKSSLSQNSPVSTCRAEEAAVRQTGWRSAGQEVTAAPLVSSVS